MIGDITCLIIYSLITCYAMMQAEYFLTHSILRYITGHHPPTGRSVNILLDSMFYIIFMIISLCITTICLSSGVEIVVRIVG